MGCFDGPLFASRYKTKVHIGQLGLVVVIVALAIGKIVTRPSYMPMNRLDMVAITMVSKHVSLQFSN